MRGIGEREVATGGGELIELWNRKRVAYPVTKIRGNSRAGGGSAGGRLGAGVGQKRRRRRRRRLAPADRKIS